jgi:hypothetical protein
MALTVEKWRDDIPGKQIMRIGGFESGELDELKSMEHYEAEEKLLDMLDYRNSNTGTCWKCGYGVYSSWYDNEFAYVTIGTSCD